ncbi:hypothetical protein MAP00_009245 [Monascus purpureus]|nr:hypothetical protein MAP00_009245 [Monascus purpureus]
MSIVGRDIYPSHLASRLKSLLLLGAARIPGHPPTTRKDSPGLPDPRQLANSYLPPTPLRRGLRWLRPLTKTGPPAATNWPAGVKVRKVPLTARRLTAEGHPAASALIPLRPAAAPIPAPSPPTGNLTPTTPGPWTPSHGDRGARASRRPGEGPRRTRIVRPPRQQQPRRGSALQCPPATQPALPLEVRGAAPLPWMAWRALRVADHPSHIYLPDTARVESGTSMFRGPNVSGRGMFLYGVVCARVIPSIQSGPPGQSQTPALSTLNEIEAAARRQLVNILERGSGPHTSRPPACSMPMSQPTSAPTGIVRPSRPAIPLSPPRQLANASRSGPVPHTSRPVTRKCPDGMCSATSVGRQLALFDRHDRPSPIASPPTGKRFEERSGPPHVHAHVPSPPGRQLALFDRHDRPTHPWFPATTPKALLGRQCQLANWQD